MSAIPRLGEPLAYMTPLGWAYAGDYFHGWEGSYMVTKMVFACGAVRFERRTASGWAVIRGTEVIPIHVCSLSERGDPVDLTPTIHQGPVASDAAAGKMER